MTLTELEYTRHYKALVAAVIMRAIDDYKVAVSFLYEYSGRDDLTINQRRFIYEAIVTVRECETAITDMARPVFGLNGTKYIQKLKKELREQYEQHEKTVCEENQADHH